MKKKIKKLNVRMRVLKTPIACAGIQIFSYCLGFMIKYIYIKLYLKNLNKFYKIYLFLHYIIYNSIQSGP